MILVTNLKDYRLGIDGVHNLLPLQIDRPLPENDDLVARVKRLAAANLVEYRFVDRIVPSVVCVVNDEVAEADPVADDDEVTQPDTIEEDAEVTQIDDAQSEIKPEAPPAEGRRKRSGKSGESQ